MNAASLRAALRLMVILDPEAARGRNLGDVAAQARAGGATMLQVRGKQLTGAALAELTRTVLGAADGIPVVVNDRLDVALATGAAGCHLGADDLPLELARALTSAGFLLGASAGSTAELRAAQAGGADYLGIGPIRATASKADAGEALGVGGFASLRRETSLPVVAIGGIRATDVAPLLAAGADGVAVIRAVLGAEDIREAVETLKRQGVET